MARYKRYAIVLIDRRTGLSVWQLKAEKGYYPSANALPKLEEIAYLLNQGGVEKGIQLLEEQRLPEVMCSRTAQKDSSVFDREVLVYLKHSYTQHAPQLDTKTATFAVVGVYPFDLFLSEKDNRSDDNRLWCVDPHVPVLYTSKWVLPLPFPVTRSIAQRSHCDAVERALVFDVPIKWGQGTEDLMVDNDVPLRNWITAIDAALTEKAVGYADQALARVPAITKKFLRTQQEAAVPVVVKVLPMDTLWHIDNTFPLRDGVYVVDDTVGAYGNPVDGSPPLMEVYFTTAEGSKLYLECGFSHLFQPLKRLLALDSAIPHLPDLARFMSDRNYRGVVSALIKMATASRSLEWKSELPLGFTTSEAGLSRALWLLMYLRLDWEQVFLSVSNGRLSIVDFTDEFYPETPPSPDW